MLPRYSPRIGWGSWLAWLLGVHRGTEDEWPAFLASLDGGELPSFHQEFETLRGGLLQYFAHVRRTRGKGTVLVPAQICRAVPLAIENAGLSVAYVDIDDAYPTPRAACYVAAVDETTVGVLVAPLYGHIQRDWSPLVAALGERLLVVDLAQGLGLGTRVAALVQRADAVAYSFGVGKGLDTGGGLLLTRSRLELPDLPRRGKAVLATALLQALAVRALVALRCYGPVVSRLDAIDATDKSIPDSGATVPDDMHRFWRARLSGLLAEIALARDRAQALAANPVIAGGLRDVKVYFDREASHLRQVIRIRDAPRRDPLVAYLRSSGVDCAPAGEPLPEVTAAAERFPRAAAFRADAVRLPFLGRLTSGQFDAFTTILERAVAHRLH